VGIATESIGDGGGEEACVDDYQDLEVELYDQFPVFLFSYKSLGIFGKAHICHDAGVIVQLHPIHRIPSRPHSRPEDEESEAMECQSCTGGCSCSVLCCFRWEGGD
jgi:hypothetical protein